MSLFSNQFFKIFLESISEGILVVNRKFDILFVNKAIFELFGYEEEELIGQRIEMLIPEKFKHNHKNHTTAYFKHPEKKQMSERDEIYGLHKNGSLLSIDIGLNHFSDSGERYAIAIISDISQSKTTNKFLKDLHSIISNSTTSYQEKINLILRLGCVNFNLPIGILSKVEGDNYAIVDIEAPEDFKTKILEEQPCLLDHTYCHDVIESEEPIYITEVNRSPMHIHPCYKKWKLETYIGVKILLEDKIYGTINFSSPNQSETIISVTDLEILKLIAQWVGYIILQQNLNEKMHMFNSELESKITSRTQELKHALSEIQDINISLKEEVEKRKQAEEHANASLEKEKQLNTLKSRFVSTASHEFRTPLTGILSSVTLIGKYADPAHEEKRNKHINIIKSSVKNLTNILNDFLSLSKLESGYVECEPYNFNLSQFVNETIEETKSTLKEGQQILFSSQKDSLSIYQDSKLLKNVIINLISNASKYSENNKTIEILVEVNEANFWIIVRDKGIGIPPEDFENMFAKFFRASNSTAYQGTGLGLNITKKNIELMQGNISFESDQNIGTTFTIELPKIYKDGKENTNN